MELVGEDLKIHWSLYQGKVYNEQQWQKEVDLSLGGLPNPSNIREGVRKLRLMSL